MADVAHTTVEELVRHRLIQAVGGLRGSVEAGLPLLGYVVAWSATKDVRLSFAVAAVLCVVLAVVAVLQRANLRHVVAGVVGVAVAAFFVRLTGRAEGAFLPGLLKTAGLATAYALSNVVRWPALGFLVGAADPDFERDPLAWRRHPEVVRVCQRLTWVVVLVFVVRLAVQVPLYAAGHVTALGLAGIALGWPLWAAALAVMGTMLARGSTPYVPVPRGETGAATS